MAKLPPASNNCETKENHEEAKENSTPVAKCVQHIFQ